MLASKTFIAGFLKMGLVVAIVGLLIYFSIIITEGEEGKGHSKDGLKFIAWLMVFFGWLAFNGI